MILEKFCPACKIVKPIDFFYNNKASKDGKVNNCKLCTAIRTLEIQNHNFKKARYVSKNKLAILVAISDYLNLNFLSFDNFVMRCPYSVEELIEKNRIQDVKEWRQIGITIKALEYNNWTVSGEHFERNHATAIHSAKVILNALEGYNKDLRDKFISCFNFDIVDIKKTLEVGLNEMICLTEQENRYFDLLNNSVTFNEVKTIFI